MTPNDQGKTSPGARPTPPPPPSKAPDQAQLPIDEPQAETPPPPAPAPAPAPKAKAAKAKAPKPANPAATLMLAQERKRNADAAAKLDAINASNLFYLRCTREPNHHALYLVEYPTTGMIHPGMWFSLDHSPNDGYFKSEVLCQECLVNGENVPVGWLKPHRMPDGQIAFSFALPPHVKKEHDGKGAGFLYRIPRDEIEARVGFTLEEIISGRPLEAAAELVSTEGGE